MVLTCTGSQGEPMAALSRIANRDHRGSVGEGDVVIMASSLIPGNEHAVFRVVNGDGGGGEDDDRARAHADPGAGGVSAGALVRRDDGEGRRVGMRRGG